MYFLPVHHVGLLCDINNWEEHMMDGADDVDGAEDVDGVEEHLLVFLPVFLLLDFSAFFLTSSFGPHLPFLFSSFLV